MRLTSIYLLVFCRVGAAVRHAGAGERDRGARRLDGDACCRRDASPSCCCGRTCRSYLELRADAVSARGADDAIAAQLARLPRHRSARAPWAGALGRCCFMRRRTAFPGIIALVLAVIAVTWRPLVTFVAIAFRMCAVAAAGCLVVSMAPRAAVLSVLHERDAAVPGRPRAGASRSQIVLLMIAVLAGFGVAGLIAPLAGGPSVAGCGGRPGARRQRRGVARADWLHVVRRRAGGV